MNINIFHDSDWPQVWPIIKKVFSEGETYMFSPDINETDAKSVWINAPRQTYVVTNEQHNMVGTYYIKANQPELGAHICNCGYIVDETARGQGLASKMCVHSQQEAISLGFKAMQFNAVVCSNKGAIHIWKKLGFDVIGTVPNAFYSKRLGYVDTLIMYKDLLKTEA